MPFRRRRRMSMPRQVIQSQKVVLNEAPQSLMIGSHENGIVLGKDDFAGGQSGPTDDSVPTGAVVKYFEIQFSVSQPETANIFMWMSIQHLRTGQVSIAANTVGGSPQRNQVHFQKMVHMGNDQNMNLVFRFKIPKKYQRVREGDRWVFAFTIDGVVTAAMQTIYKYYR